MGAALKTDPTRIRVAEFWKAEVCPLAKALRSRLKKAGGVDKKFVCVYSDEVLENKGYSLISQANDEFSDTESEGSVWDSRKARINGTTSYMPAMFGMTITSLVVRAIMNEI